MSMTLPTGTIERAVVCAGRLVTCDERWDSARGGDGSGSPAGLGVIEGGAVLIERGRIVAVGPRDEVLAASGGAPVLLDDASALVTPGLIDAHTHAAWVGMRHDEYAVRLAGGDYEAIAEAGGGIRSTMHALRSAGLDQIASTLTARLGRMAAQGVTTIEVKSGYGLDEAGERKQLEAISLARASGTPTAATPPGAGGLPLPRVVPTYLALHAIPPEWEGRRDEYVAEVASRWLPSFAAGGLCRYVDAYVDRGAFTVEEARLVLGKARALGLGVRLHAGQFADIGAAELAAELGAASADHLEQVSPRGVGALADAGVAAVLLPVAAWTLGQAPPPVDSFRKHGIRMVVASDANPGTAPTESLPLAMAMAARAYGLTPAEALLGATTHAARCLGLEGEAGILRAGASADIVAWGLPHESAIIQPWGAPPIVWVMARGNIVSPRPARGPRRSGLSPPRGGGRPGSRRPRRRRGRARAPRRAAGRSSRWPRRAGQSRSPPPRRSWGAGGSRSCPAGC
jgi:imidazolonepropionase